MLGLALAMEDCKRVIVELLYQTFHESVKWRSQDVILTMPIDIQGFNSFQHQKSTGQSCHDMTQLYSFAISLYWGSANGPEIATDSIVITG